MNEERDPEQELERTVEELEHEREKLGDELDEVREDWEAKKSSPGVPGAQEES